MPLAADKEWLYYRHACDHRIDSTRFRFVLVIAIHVATGSRHVLHPKTAQRMLEAYA